MEDHRNAPRRRVLKAGSVMFDGGGVMDCTLRNVSESGAALEVESGLFIPDQFTLVVPGDQSKWPCRVVWRKGKRVGVAFA